MWSTSSIKRDHCRFANFSRCSGSNILGWTNKSFHFHPTKRFLFWIFSYWLVLALFARREIQDIIKIVDRNWKKWSGMLKKSWNVLNVISVYDISPLDCLDATVLTGYNENFTYRSFAQAELEPANSAT